VTGPQVQPFDVCGPLPEGTAVLEASAGTGKTFTIAALATRYVAEGLDLSQVMLVTFSRAATQELRERVRERLAAAEAALADPCRAREGADPLVALLAEGPDEHVAVRRQRLARALADFDTATIATTHGFCQQMLAGLGMAGDTDPDAGFVERVDDLVAEVVDDLYLRKFAPPGTSPPAITHATARQVAAEAMQDRHAGLVTHDTGSSPTAHQRYGIAAAVRREVDARKRARRLLDYDDLLTRLRDTLVDPVRGPAARRRVRSRYRVVLVDEFQDTDPVQWQILRSTFHGTTTLVLIGDPKQAIYAFRGADLVTYLSAAADATSRRTLARNWRSDHDLLHALHTLFGGAALGDADIMVRPVEAQHVARRLHGTPCDVPLRLRVVRRDQGERAGNQDVLRVGSVRPLIAEDLAADVARVLGSGATLDDGARPVRPGDVAVLVRTNDQAVRVRDALTTVRVPAVLTGSSSVFLTRSAREWLVLLRALEQPHRAGLVRAAALTRFLGWSAGELGTAGDDRLDALGQRLRDWRDVLARRGVAALLEVVTASERLVERLLATADGERELTDLRHVGEALHAAAVRAQLGSAALVEWLQHRISEASGDSAEERSRRLESDADAVQVVTVHSSKGLEFPLVYVPFGWDRHVRDTPDPLRLHDDDGTRLLDVGGETGDGYARRRLLHEQEELGEELRLLYVAMTRAQCQVVTWWAPSTNTPTSALHRLLFGFFAPGEQPPDHAAVPSDAEARRVLEEKAASSAGTLAVETVADDRTATWQPAHETPARLRVGTFGRSLDTAWRRTSYTALTSAAHEPPGVGSEPEAQERQDEAVPGPAAADRLPDQADPDAHLRTVASPMADLPGGATFGTLVHEVLETVDTTAVDLAAEIRGRCEQAVSRRLARSLDVEQLASAMQAVFDSPLGPLADGLRLRDIAPADRLAEVGFELPLAGGDEPRATDATLAAVADLLDRHLPATDPLAEYPHTLRAPGLQTHRLRGYLTGSVDAVLRLRDQQGEPRFVVVDYKTNRLGGFVTSGAEPLTAWHYRPAALTDTMARAHYPLQALLYSVALHRFLRWRHRGYDPARHLGGVLYLFTRGMCGPATPQVDGTPCGTFPWRPSPALVEDLSRLLDRGAP
jgi:exodeoxyribonuclease V beta subunit